MTHDVKDSYAAVLIDDMIFASKVREAARKSGVRLEFIKYAAGLTDKMASIPPSFFIVDLGSRKLDPFTLIREIKNSAGLSGVPVIGYLPHVETELKKEAYAAGYDLVVPRSWMSMNVSKIFTDFSEGKGLPPASAQ